MFPRGTRVATVVAVAAVSGVIGGPVTAAEADTGPAFMPTPASKAVYAASPPSDDPGRRHYVAGAGGTKIYVETWLPAQRDGRRPPERVPTVLIASPYEDVGKATVEPFEQIFAAYMAERGYAAAITHTRGTARSGGCHEFWGALETEDTLRVIDYLANHAPWSSGAVGMYGLSYQATAQLGPATSGDPRADALRAIVPISGPPGFYPAVAVDGVPLTAVGPLAPLVYLQFGVSPDGPGLETAERANCTPDNLRGVRTDGRFGDYDAEREHRRGLRRLRAAALLVQGLADDNFTPGATAGYFDRVPADTPHRVIVGQWDHAWPDHVWPDSVRDWRRADWLDIVVAWYDEHLKGLDTGTGDWPPVQVQGSDGQWRAEAAWPTTGGAAGQLALGRAGRLGERNPEGSSAFPQTSEMRDAWGPVDRDSGSVVFATQPLTKPLRLTGQPEADLWVRVTDPRARIAARLRLLDDAGRELTTMPVVGARSVQYREPLVEGRFEQRVPNDPPLGEPFRITVRLAPVDVVVPAGGRVELELAGSATWRVIKYQTTTEPAPGPGSVEVLHDCRHPSTLRFLLARRHPALFDVREPGEDLLGEVDAPEQWVVDGGVAREEVCGRPPIRTDVLGPRRPPVQWP